MKNCKSQFIEIFYYNNVNVFIENTHLIKEFKGMTLMVLHWKVPSGVKIKIDLNE